jgi:hypothetical protein
MTSSSQHIDFHTIVIEDVQVRSIMLWFLSSKWNIFKNMAIKLKG